MLTFGLFGYFVLGGSPTLFGLGRGPITPPDPAMVRAVRKDLNSNKTKNEIKLYSAFLASFPRWFAHLILALGGIQLPLPVLQWSKRTERT